MLMNMLIWLRKCLILWAVSGECPYIVSIFCSGDRSTFMAHHSTSTQWLSLMLHMISMVNFNLERCVASKMRLWPTAVSWFTFVWERLPSRKWGELHLGWVGVWREESLLAHPNATQTAQYSTTQSVVDRRHSHLCVLKRSNVLYS